MAHSRLAGASLLALLGMAAIGANAAAQDIAGEPAKVGSNIAVTRADAVDATGQVCTAAPFFVDMPSLSETFTIAGGTPRRVIVLFQGEFGLLAEGSAAIIQLTIDGVPQSGPGAAADLHADHHPTGEANQAGTHGFNFISDRLDPGTHTAKIAWKDNGVGPACVFARSMIILHN